MPSPTDVANQVFTTDAPVLFLDTCCLLDIIREPYRANNKGSVKAAIELREMCLKSPPTCSLVVGSFVTSEWKDHDQATLAELSRHVERMEEHAAEFHSLCADLGIHLGFQRPSYMASGFATRLHHLSNQILQLATEIGRDNDIVLLSYNRAFVTKRRPSRQGTELKDCTIFEECLEVCRRLQSVGFAKKRVYCTSNTADYCATGAVPHADIDADCSTVGLKFTTTIPWAISELKKQKP